MTDWHDRYRRPFEIIEAGAHADVLLVCDHASHAVPDELNALGLDARQIRQHIGWDIGAAEVTRGLARQLAAPAVLAGFTRLVIDPNRPPGQKDSITPVSDGIAIPANRKLGPGEPARRREHYFDRYHGAIEHQLDKIVAGTVPMLISIHSFTPRMNGDTRPWHAGLLYADDDRMVAPAMAEFARHYPGLVVGDNEPYTGHSPTSYSVPHHAERRGLPNITFEIRQDLIGTAAGIAAWVAILLAVLERPLADRRWRTVRGRISGDRTLSRGGTA